MLNRSALIVRPAAPYLAWAKSLDGAGVDPDPAGEQTVYLIPEWNDDEEAGLILQSMFADIFERELFGWHTDPDQWPQDRSYTAFKKWFVIEMHSLIEDLCANPLEADEG